MKTWLMKCCNNIVTGPDSNTAVWTQQVMKSGSGAVSRWSLVAATLSLDGLGAVFAPRSPSECKVGGLGRAMNETKLMTDRTQTLGDVIFDVTYKATDERPKF